MANPTKFTVDMLMKPCYGDKAEVASLAKRMVAKYECRIGFDICMSRLDSLKRMISKFERGGRNEK